MQWADVINTPGTHFVSDQAVWRQDWPPETPLQFRRIPPHSTLRPGISGEESPRSPDNAEPRATSSTKGADPMERYFSMYSDSD